MQENKMYQFKVRVYIEDTDLMSIVNHPNYLCFFERARTEMIRESGLSLTTLAAYHCHFAITEVNLRYIHPARLDDLLTISTEIESRKPCSRVFRQVMHNQDNQLLCEALIKLACADEKMKPRRLPENIL